MKAFVLLAIAASLHGANAQAIKASNRSTTGYVRKDGTIENASRSTIGYAKGVPRESAASCSSFSGSIERAHEGKSPHPDPAKPGYAEEYTPPRCA